MASMMLLVLISGVSIIVLLLLVFAIAMIDGHVLPAPNFASLLFYVGIVGVFSPRHLTE